MTVKISFNGSKYKSIIFNLVNIYIIYNVKLIYKKTVKIITTIISCNRNSEKIVISKWHEKKISNNCK